LWTERRERILCAGEIWLRNFDLRPFSQLWITDVAAKLSFIFRRCCRPAEYHVTLGPIDDLIVERGEWLFDYPIVYREANESPFDDLLYKLASDDEV
jgi:hypothetical protein